MAMRAWFRRLRLRYKIRRLLPKLTDAELAYFYDTIRACTSREWRQLNRLALVREEARTLPMRVHPTPRTGILIVGDDKEPHRLPKETSPKD